MGFWITIFSISLIKLAKILQALFSYEVNYIGGTLSAASLTITTNWSSGFFNILLVKKMR